VRLRLGDLLRQEGAVVAFPCRIISRYLKFWISRSVAGSFCTGATSFQAPERRGPPGEAL